MRRSLDEVCEPQTLNEQLRVRNRFVSAVDPCDEQPGQVLEGVADRMQPRRLHAQTTKPGLGRARSHQRHPATMPHRTEPSAVVESRTRRTAMDRRDTTLSFRLGVGDLLLIGVNAR